VSALDPHFVSSTGICVKNGMHPLEVREILDAALKHEQLKSLDIVEFNPHVGDVESSTKAIKEVFKDLVTNKIKI
jgi:arginase family enzyme